MATSITYRSAKKIREYEYHELMKLERYEEAAEIARENQEWFENEAQRWADLEGEAQLGMSR